ncbi:axotactin-like isoform X3 [Daphnia carinata]|uniref:axotactin-like isoform X3 n=1 Tax=Daphnia carinata TaxID=120202 RepID=UPI002868B324|nr:axotactin-like isoform X3 [Daphnia carinata]
MGMEHHYGGLNRRALMFVLLLMAVALADEDHLESSDATTPDLTTDTSIPFTERDEFPNDVETDDDASMMLAVEKTTTTHVCQAPADPGPCTAELIKFFYDSTAQRCRQFIYGGCDGNENNFVTEAECLQTCGHALVGQPLRDNYNNDFPTDTSPSYADKDEILTLANGQGETSFTFSAEYPFIQLKAVDISAFKLRQIREIHFEFRSPEAQGLLLYQTLRNPPPDEPKYELYVLLEGGELKTIHVFGANETTLLVGKGLNRDWWHRVKINVDPTIASLQVQVDDETQSIVIEGLDKDAGYGRRQHINSTLFIGGMNWAQDEVESSYLFEHFVGCLRNVQLKTGSDLSIVQPLKASAHRDIVEGCVDKCKAGENRCRNGGKCLNRYHSTACDCFGTKYEGDSCDYDSATTITLRGYSYISYRIYDWKDRAHSESNRISVIFRALMGDSILFYAGGTFPYTNHVAVTLLANSSLYVEVDFGDGPHGVHLGEDLTTGVWNNFTLVHNGNVLNFILNGREHKMIVQGSRYYLRFDPHIFVGGDRKPLGLGLRSSNNFVGCLSEVYFNDVSILQKLRTNSPHVLYHSIFRPEIGQCKDVPVVPITLPFQESKLSISLKTVPSSEQKLQINLGFKTRNSTAVLAHGTGITDNGNVGLWELKLNKGEMQFRIFEDASNESLSVTVLKKGQRLADGSWHQVHLVYGLDGVSLAVDYRRPEFKNLNQANVPTLTLDEDSVIVIGVGYLDSQPGFIGCIRDLVLNRRKLDPRALLYTAEVREISLDNCQLVDPCHRPNACEHGGLCNVDEGRVVCDCTGTGYTGKNCHFALYKRTCEELALLGYMKSGVYEIDIDGNGPHPPAHVRCEFEANSGVRKTVVEHNLPHDAEIRGLSMDDVVFNLTYREFSAEMLQSLISQSLQCKQILRYDCYKAPIELHSYTWFRSAAGNLLDSIPLGKAKPGRCPCSQNQNCKHSSVFCNCDADEPRWLSDEGYLTQPEDLGITQIFALQQRKLVPQSEGRITLGPLECVEANTQQYVVTFKSPDSYMEVPGWHRGDLAFSFRTSSERAILLYQPLLHPKHPYFRVLLVNDHKLTLEFSINGEPRSVTVKSSRDLNSGEWQQVWIDYNEYHVRFTVNQESILVDLNDGEEFGPFEATLFIGGAPEEMLGSEMAPHTDGLVGCFRGLVMNNEVVNLYAYMNARFPDMIQKHCRPSCDPNPCKNGASCVEFWGSYKCVCKNPLAHFGYNCEIDINQNAITFRTATSFVEANATTFDIAKNMGLSGFFQQDILINLRTFDSRSLIFYAYDYHNNFVQLHIEDDNQVVFTFNSANTIHSVSTVVKGLTTGDSIQILIDREPESTTLHVNTEKSTVEAPLLLMDTYARSPWVNKEKEMIRPPRPVRRPEEFYQVFLGGVDQDYMTTSLGGYTGCLRGLSVGGNILDLTSKGAEGIGRDGGEESGVVHSCNMLCDQQPCQNEGVCLEDFRSNTYHCDCEMTSYSGPYCTEEKGAHFRGDSYITAHYASLDLDAIKIQLAFSTTAVRNIAQALLLIQTSKAKTKYLLVSLTALGYLRIEDDRGNGIVYGAEVKTINFLNGARHSVYYKRNGANAVLLVDRDDVPLRPLSTSIHPDGLAEVTDENAIHVGGVKVTNDPRFTDYDHFDGCISNVVVELDDNQLHPLLAYLGYQRSGLEAVTSHDPEGIEEEARCAAFSVTPPGVVEDDMDSYNDTSDEEWRPKPPLILPYKPVFVGPANYDPTTSNRILVGLGCIFLAGLIALTIYLCKTHRRSKRRQYLQDDEQFLIFPSSAQKAPIRPALRNNPIRNVGVTAPVAHVLDIPKLESQSGFNCLKNEVIPTSGTQIVYNLLESISNQENENPLEKPSDIPSDAIPYLDDQEVDTLMSDISEQSREVTSSFDETGTISRGSLEGSETQLEGLPSASSNDTEAPHPSEETSSAAALVACMPLAIEMVTDVLRNAQNILENDAELDKEIDLINLSQLVPENNVRGDIDPNHDAEAEDENNVADHPAPLADTSLDSNADPCTNDDILTVPKKRAPIERISEAFLSDDDDDGSVSVANTEKELADAEYPMDSNQQTQQPKAVTRNTVTKDNQFFLMPRYGAESVRNYANPLSYLGGPRLLTKNLQKTSKESILSIDE